MCFKCYPDTNEMIKFLEEVGHEKNMMTYPFYQARDFARINCILSSNKTLSHKRNSHTYTYETIQTKNWQLNFSKKAKTIKDFEIDDLKL